jgi:hypothetical protein
MLVERAGVANIKMVTRHKELSFCIVILRLLMAVSALSFGPNCELESLLRHVQKLCSVL